MVKKFSLVKLNNYYDGNYDKFRLTNTGQEKVLISLLQSGKPKIANKWLDRFSTYFVENLSDILQIKKSRSRGKIILIQDSRNPLISYVTRNMDVVINFTKRLNEYSRHELLSILLYGFTYWGSFHIKNMMKADSWLYLQTHVLHTFMMNLFGKKYGTFGEPDLIDLSLYLCGLHVVVNLWGLPFKSYSTKLITHYRLNKLETQYIQAVIKYDRSNFDVFKWIDLLDHWVFKGLTVQAISSRVSQLFSLETLVGLESVDRFNAFIYGSKFSSYFGPVDYYTPEDQTNKLVLSITKDLISSLEV